MKRALLILPLLTLFACEDGELGVLLPQIAIDACSDGVIEVAGQTMGGTGACVVEFGTVSFGAPRRIEMMIANPSNVSLRVDEVILSPDSDPAYFVEGFPAEVPASTSLPLIVWFRPVVAETVRGSILVRTDGSNAPVTGITIDLAGAGAEGGGILEVSPAACDFGLKAPGSTSRCDLQLAVRAASVSILSAEVVGDASFSLDGATPGQIPQNSSATLTVLFTPAQIQSFTGTLVLQTSDVARPLIEIPLRGQGADGPQCDIVISEINGGVANGTPTLEPLDDITLRVNSSHPDAFTVWAFLDTPNGSNVGFATPTANETRLLFNGNNFGIDVAGLYRLQAIQTDVASGTTGSCELTFTAVPDDELLVQLSWDTAAGDLDLHVIQQDDGGRYCARAVVPGENTEDCGPEVYQDCYYFSCRPTSSLIPDWDTDGVAGSGGDPSLDVDDLCGFGPENINIDFPRGGRYLIGVDHFGFTGCDGAGPSFATIRIYSYGALISELVQEVSPGDFWEAGVVVWPEGSGQVCVEDLSTPISECP